MSARSLQVFEVWVTRRERWAVELSVTDAYEAHEQLDAYLEAVGTLSDPCTPPLGRVRRLGEQRYVESVYARDPEILEDE